MKNKLFDVGTRVWIREDSEHYEQGTRMGKRLIGKITEDRVIGYSKTTLSSEYYCYRVVWYDNNGNNVDGNVYRHKDLELMDVEVCDE